MKRLGITATLLFLVSCSGGPQDPRGAEGPPAVSDVTPAVASGGADLVVHVAGRTFVLLDNEVAVGMGVGEPTLLENKDDVMTVTRAIAPSKLPAQLLSAKSSAVTVVADSGTRCVAQVSDVVLFTQVSPYEKLENAEQAFELGEHGAHIALALDLDRESCTGAHFALVSGDAETARPLPANDASTETVTVAFRAMREWQAYENQYEEYFAARSEAEDKINGVVRAASWDTYGGQTPSVRRFVLGNESLLFVTAGVDEGCGGLHTQLSVLFRETAEGPIAIRTWEDFSREPVAIVTAPGGYDVIFDSVKARTNDAYPSNVEPLIFGCRC